ncbi:Hint domain-containing protein [Chachezhania sediminis]|uniref:Hint domain-containing protein n=1 Tax=Chachezhania sediminis TaxID=2599291 RepID=UPI00131EA40A|nr:Hint domain-containing protein [Chachezhania sediminis]
MGTFNISDVGGQTAGGGSSSLDTWTATLDITNGRPSTVSGNFDVVTLGGDDLGDASGGYTFGNLSQPGLGTLVTNTTTGTYTFTVDWDAVLDTENNQVVTFTVTGTQGTSQDQDTVIINLVICVARGTLIATPTGPRRVEDLEVGDNVTTHDGPPAPVRWIGSKPISPDELARSPKLWPVVVSAGALGPNHPRRALTLSPQHRILVSGTGVDLLFGVPEVLVPAKALTNGDTIRQVPLDGGVEYFHVLLDKHEIIFTENLPTESFHPGNYCTKGLAPDDYGRLMAALAGRSYGHTARPVLRVWEGRLLAPLPQNAYS